MNGVCGLEITKECEERPCLGCDVFQRFRLSDLVSLSTMNATEEAMQGDWAADTDDYRDLIETQEDARQLGLQ